MVLYAIALILFAVFCVLWLILRRLDVIVDLLGGRAAIVKDDSSVPPSNVYSRHSEVIDKWKRGG